MEFGGRYAVNGQPLDGGMGRVYPCWDPILERKVAIKVVQGDVDERRMQDEVRALLALRSKHVVQVYDMLRLEDGSSAIVQEFIEGNDLFAESTRPTTAEQLYKQLWQIATGIADIHRAGVIHRDIKPNNMKLDREGLVKVFDFGLARREGMDASTMGFVGTRGFAAPELFRQEAEFTSAVDVYAFGATALYLSARQLPPEVMAAPPTEVPHDRLLADLPWLASDVRGVIGQSLAVEAGDRPSMSDIQYLLSRYLLQERHQGLLVFQGQASYLNAGRRTVTAKLTGMGGLRITYTGLDFQLSEVEGEVYINDRQAANEMVLPASCVIALGGPAQGNRRRYITFDLSSPEVVL